MSKLVIEGGEQLVGDIGVNGAKNAALPLLAATLLTEGMVEIDNVPGILDVQHLLEVIDATGADVEQDGQKVRVTAKEVNAYGIPHETVGKLRGSILLLGALLGRTREAHLPLPGGDVIGARPVDEHLDAFEQLGAKVHVEQGMVHIDGSEMKAGTVVLRKFSVTATENALLVAATLPGTTTIHITAKEPHVVALAELLSSMGANISGAGTDTIVVTGSENLAGGKVTTPPDMLEAGLFILLAAATKSEMTVRNVPTANLQLFFKKLDDIGVAYTIDGANVHVSPSPLKAFQVQTLPHPGIATDLQAPFAVMATGAQGTSLIHDPMYESRFRHCDELVKMGAAITVCDPHRVVIEGPTQLRAQNISSLDIRSGATLIMAGLVAEGQTVIAEAEIIDRGYANLTERLQALGAKIQRVDDSWQVGEPLPATWKTAVT